MNRIKQLTDRKEIRMTLFTDKERAELVADMKEAYQNYDMPDDEFGDWVTCAMKSALAVAETAIRNATLEEAAATAENILELGDGCEVLPNQTGKYVAKLIRAMKEPTK